jgi:hypothetical protein
MYQNTFFLAIILINIFFKLDLEKTCFFVKKWIYFHGYVKNRIFYSRKQKLTFL